MGQNDFEEIDILQPGLNYGWNRMEGGHCFPPSVRNCDQAGLEYPLTGRRCAVIGGYVYRGARLDSLYGAYLYADFCSGEIWALHYDSEKVTDNTLLKDSDLNISAFGEDEAGEMYILAFDGGIYRFLAP